MFGGRIELVSHGHKHHQVSIAHFLNNISTSQSNVDEVHREQLGDFVLLVVDELALVAQPPDLLLQGANALLESLIDCPSVDGLQDSLDLTLVYVSLITVARHQGRAERLLGHQVV